MSDLCFKMTVAMKPKTMNLQKITSDHHDKKNLLIKMRFFMVLRHQRSVQNSKSNNSSTNKLNLSNNTNIHICDAASNVTLDDYPGYRQRDHPNNIRMLNRKSSTPLLIYHQNIKGLQNKIDELSMLWSTNFPHVLCFTEHHPHDHEINFTYINSYNLGAKYCRVNLKHGGVSIFVHETLPFTTIDLSEFCIDQDIEICAIKLHFSLVKFCVMSVYRAPSGNFIHFLSTLDSILSHLYNNSLNFIICGDFNINYLENSNGKLQLDSLLAS